MDHCEGDGEWPIVELSVKNVFIVDNHGERKKDPDWHIKVGKDDLFHHPTRLIFFPLRWLRQAAVAVEVVVWDCSDEGLGGNK